jgi:GT2 family glycosyltransferase
MPFIGYSRTKKIKKLYLLAKTIISQWGWKYFFYVVRLEFKKQGLSVFIPDEKPQPSFLQKNYQNDYDQYLKHMHQNLSKELVDFSKIKSPVITILILYDGNSEKLDLTMDSVQKQHYKNWNVILLPINSQSFEKISKTNYPNIKQIIFSQNEKNFTEQIKNFKSDFFCILKTGNLLDEFAFSKFILYLNHDDSDLIYSDHDVIKENHRTYPFFKPDWSPYLFRSMDFLSPFCLIKAQIFNKIQFDTKYLNCFEYDVLLKCVELTNKISHISLPLCSVSKHINSKNKIQCNKEIVQNHLNRIQIKADVENGIVKNTLKLNYKINSKLKVSILIPTRNNYKMLKRCIESIEKNTNYSNKEIIIIDNDSEHPQVKKYYDSLSYKIINFKGNFNFSKMNNLAVKQSLGELLLFLNDDTKMLDSNWLDELVGICIQSDVGAVGPKLIFSDDTIQHAGIVFLKTGSGFHPGMRLEKNTDAYHGIVNSIRDYSAVTGACLMVKKEIFDKVGGFDDQFDVYYGDSDLCLKIINAGFRVVYTPFTELLHEGSNTIHFAHSGATFFDVESHQIFIQKWSYLKNGDPYYNTNLDWDYSISKTYFNKV